MIRWFTILLLIAVASVRAETASRLYEQGKYAEALERYRKAAEKEAENWPLFYDLGAAAYKAGRPDEAAKAFERALGSKDGTLQAKALYNLGNSYFRLGEAAERQSLEQALPQYQHSLKGYENSLVIDPHDGDAKFNLEVVKKKIEELQRQQQEEQNQQQQQQQKNQQQQNKEQQEQQQNQQQNPENREQQQQAQQSPKPEEKQAQPQRQRAPAQGQGQEQKPEPEPGQGSDFDKAQAAMLLNNLREDEKTWNFFPELLVKTNQMSEPQKDW